MSCKKDGLANSGGFVSIKHDQRVYKKASAACVLMEGFITYGGMSGRDMECAASGLLEGMDEDYLTHRIGQVSYLGHELREMGVPIQWPPGG